MRAALALALAAGVLVGWVRPASPGATGDLDRVASDAIAGWLERRPECATPLGVHAHDGRLRPVTASSVADDLAWLGGIAARLEAIPRQELAAPRRADRDRLAGWIEQQRLLLAEVEPHLDDPGHPLPSIDHGIRSLLANDLLPPCERVRAITARLERVPEMLRSARVLLRDPSRPAVLAAIAGAEDLLALLRRGVPEITRDCRESTFQADLAEADTVAVRALETYRVALREDLLPRAGPAAGMGGPALARLLAAAESETGSPDSLLARAEREIAERRARLLVLAERVAPGRGIAGAAATLARDSIPDGSLPRTIAATLDSLRRRAQREAWVGLPKLRGLEVQWTLVPGRERPPLRLLAPGAFETGRRRTRLVYESAGAATSSAWLAARHDAFTRAALPWALVHEAIPGRWPFEDARRSCSRVRQVFPAASAVEGWCGYAEALAREPEGADQDPRVEFAGERRAIERLARGAAALAMHLRGTGDEEETARLVERTLLHPEIGARAVADARADPVAAIAPMLGEWRLRDLRDETRARMGARFSLRRFHEAVLAQGPIPLPLAREGVRRSLEGGPRQR